MEVTILEEFNKVTDNEPPIIPTANDPNEEGFELFCKLSNPVKVGDGINAYVTYEVSTNRSGSLWTVLRRYSDFSWLQDMLKEEFKHILIPPLPEKVLFDRFTPELVEYRRNELEKFLKRILEHPQLNSSPSVNTFLCVSDGGIDAEKLKLKSVSEKISKKEESKGFFASLTAGFITSAVTTFVEVKETDPFFTSEKAYLASLEPSLIELATKSSANFKKNQEFVSSLVELGYAASQMNRSEVLQNNNLAVLWGKLSEILSQMAILMDERVKEETNCFLHPIRDYIRMVGACQSLVANRDSVLVELQMCKDDTAAKTERHAKVQGTPRANALAVELQTAQDTEWETDRKCYLLSESIKSELEAFRVKKRQNLSQTLGDLVRLNINHLLLVISLWKELLIAIEEQEQEEQV